MRAERLLRLVLLLQARGRVTAATLARELEVSTRTVKRDMEALSGAGIPVYATRGGAGGWALVDSYRTSLTGLTTSDALAIVVGRSYGILADLGLADPGDGPVLKLMAAIAPTARAQVEHARQRVHVDTGPGGGSPPAPDPVLVDLQRAIWDDLLVGIRYGTSPVDVRLAPLGLVRQGTTWYLVAGLDEPRTYRVSRVHRVTIVEETFDRPAGFDLASHWRAASKEFVGTRSSYPVRLRLRGAAVVRAGWVYARSRSIGLADSDGWVDADLDLGDEENAQTVVRQLGAETFVVAPDDLREATVAYARDVLHAHHRGPG